MPSRGLCAVMILVMGACAQMPDTARVNVGVGLIKDQPAKDYAALYLPYAKMASIAYTDEDFLKGGCPDPYLLQTRPAKTQLQEARNRNNARWLRDLTEKGGWSCIFGRFNPPERDPRECPDPCEVVKGLELHVWKRQSGRGCEVVIAFRGTDPEPGDWASNLRWFIRSPHRFDEYSQTKLHMPGILRGIRAGCASPHIVTTGHSLGGGLAQHAAYAAGGAIRYVYAFDSSPVTGYFDVRQDVRIKAREGLGIDRIYEVGEVLDFPRFFLGGFVNPQPCNPRIRMVRFEFTMRGDAVKQHSMPDLTRRMQRAAKHGDPAQARGERDARHCTFVVPGQV